MPALLRRDKTCCWWDGGKASQGQSEQRAGSTRATHGEHPEQKAQAGGAGMGTPTLEVLEAVAAQQAEG